MPDVPEAIMGGAKVSRGFFAALLEAQKSECNCECVKILKKVADEISKEFKV